LFDEKIEEISCRHIIRVAFESAADTEFDYAVPDEIWPIEAGQRVEVPFGKKNKLEVGFCVGSTSSPQVETDITREKAQKRQFKLKKIIMVVDKEPLLGPELMELAWWISSYYVCPLGQVLAAMVPRAVKKGAGARTGKYIYLAIAAPDVGEIAKQLRGKRQKQIVQYLQQKGAFNSDAALELQGVLEAIGCGKEPVKKLAEKQIIKIAEKTILKSLPAIPKGMSITTEKVVLNEDQQKALAYFRAQIESGKFGVTLLHGVTDSGKTELYIRAIEVVLQKGKSALVLLPEIALTTQTVQRFSARFKNIAVMHSGLTAAQRNVQWQKDCCSAECAVAEDKVRRG